jgi:hypothetical protein
MDRQKGAFMAKSDSESERQELTPEAAAGAHIGHNSAKAEIDPNETICERERDASRHIKHWADVDTEYLQRSTNTSYDVLVTIWSLIIAIVESGGLPAFYRTRGIPVHGNTKNAFQPLVAYLLRNHDTPGSRQTIWRWSAVMYVAYKAQISVHAMPDWLREFGLDKIAADYKKLRNGEDPVHDLSDAEIGESIRLPQDDYTLLQPTPLIARLRAGKTILEVDCNPNTGKAHVSVVFRCDEPQVNKMVAAEARRRFAAGK